VKILAIDPSLTHLGWAKSWDGEITYGVVKPPAPNGNPKAALARLLMLREAVLLAAQGMDLVVLEGYAYGAQGRAIVSLGELGGVLRLAFFEKDVPVLEVPPSNLKIFATGKGTSKKPELMAAAFKRLAYQGSDEHEVDALWLLALARYHYDELPPRFVPLGHLRGLDKLHYPFPRTHPALGSRP